MRKPIRVLIVDDHPVVREGLRLMLETSPDMELVAEAPDGEAAIRAAAELLPDVVLMDLRLPGLDGAAATGAIIAGHPGMAVVVLTTYDDDGLGLDAVAAGALGYLGKDCDMATLHATIKAAASGQITVGRAILAAAIARQRSRASIAQLTDREMEILQRVAVGDRNAEVATRLGITERTVRAHLSSVFMKLGAESRTAAVALARTNGLLP